MFWTGNPSELLLEAPHQPQLEGSEKSPILEEKNSNSEGVTMSKDTVVKKDNPIPRGV